MDGHHHGEDPVDHHHAFESPMAAEFAELEGEVLAGLVTQGVSVLAELCRPRGVSVRRLIDIGCGPGVGTCALAQAFGSASVVAVDGSATMLELVTANARRLGLAGQVQTSLVELPAGLGTLGAADVVWASMVLHHLGDEAGAIRGIRGLLRPGGLLAVVEQAGPVRVVSGSTDIGRPGMWERLDDAWTRVVDRYARRPAAGHPVRRAPGGARGGRPRGRGRKDARSRPRLTVGRTGASLRQRHSAPDARPARASCRRRRPGSARRD